jgi:hypothetical protein
MTPKASRDSVDEVAPARNAWAFLAGRHAAFAEHDPRTWREEEQPRQRDWQSPAHSRHASSD